MIDILFPKQIGGLSVKSWTKTEWTPLATFVRTSHAETGLSGLSSSFDVALN